MSLRQCSGVQPDLRGWAAVGVAVRLDVGVLNRMGTMAR